MLKHRIGRRPHLSLMTPQGNDDKKAKNEYVENSSVTSNGDAPYLSAQNGVNGMIIPNASMSKKTISNRTPIAPLPGGLLIISAI